MVTRGWAMYFRHSAASATYHYLGHYTWLRIGRWMRAKHPHRSWKWLRRRYTRNGWPPEQDGITMFHPATVTIQRYRYRGSVIPTPWSVLPQSA